MGETVDGADAVGLPSDGRPENLASDRSTICSPEENLVAKGEAFEGRGLRLSGKADDTFDWARALVEGSDDFLGVNVSR